MCVPVSSLKHFTSAKKVNFMSDVSVMKALLRKPGLSSPQCELRPCLLFPRQHTGGNWNERVKTVVTTRAKSREKSRVHPHGLNKSVRQARGTDESD